MCAPPPAYSQTDEQLPSAAALFERYVAATGGQAAYDGVQNEVMKYTVSGGGQVLAQVVSYRTRSGDYRETGEALGGHADAGVNGGVAWKRMGDTAQLLETGEDRAQALRASVLLPDGVWRRFYPTAETVGSGMIDGKPCYILKVVPFVGGPQTLYYEKQKGLLLRKVGPGPNGVADYAFEEYFEAGGIRVPRLLTITSLGVTLRVVVNEVKYNQPIPDSIFEPPPEISRLLKKRSAVR
jgi:hypothetical protein